MTFLYKPITLIPEFYYMSNSLNFCNIQYIFSNLLPMLEHDLDMACTKFQTNRFRIDG